MALTSFKEERNWNRETTLHSPVEEDGVQQSRFANQWLLARKETSESSEKIMARCTSSQHFNSKAE